MKTKIFSLLVLAIGLLVNTNAFAQNEQDVSLNVEYTYSVTNGNGDWTGTTTYNWTIAPATGWNSSTSLGTTATNKITWTTAGIYTITVQAVDSKGCYSEPITRTITVTDETYCIANQTNTVTCSLLAAPSTGNATSTLADNFTFDVTISHPATSGSYAVELLVGSTTVTKTISAVVAGVDKTTTITVSHLDAASEFENNNSASKTVAVNVTNVKNAATTPATVSECNTPFTFTGITVNPKPVISF